MKKLLFIGAALFGASIGFCAEQYNNVGAINISSATVLGAFSLPQKTATQLLTLTAKTTGQVMICSDCNVKFCLITSTGNTAPYQWILSTGTAAK